MYRPTPQEIEALNALGISEHIKDYPVTISRLAAVLAAMLKDQYPDLELTQTDKPKR
jgi:hypothetical protein